MHGIRCTVVARKAVTLGIPIVEIFVTPTRPNGRALVACPSRRAHARAIKRCHTSCINVATPLCSARLRDGSSCRSVPTRGDLCEHHARLADELGRDTVVNGDYSKKRNARQRTPVDAETEPLKLRSHVFGRPSAVRPALALTAAEEVETIRRVLLEAATSTSQGVVGDMHLSRVREELPPGDLCSGSRCRIKAVETLLREGLGRVGEAEVAEPRMPTSVADVEALSWNEMKFIFAIFYAQAIRRSSIKATRLSAPELERWEPEAREAVVERSPESPERSCRLTSA